MSNLVERRGLLLATLGAPLLIACSPPQTFDLRWDEEVQLQEEAMLLLTTKVQFQRNSAFSKYENARRRITTLSFDAGQGYGVIKFTTWLRPVFVDRIRGKWYLVLSGQGPFGKTDESADFWGHDFTTREQRLAMLEGNAFRPAAWEMAPVSIKRENLLPLIETVELAKLDGKKVSIAEKERLSRDQPMEPSLRDITRPQRMTSLATNLSRLTW